MDIRKLQRAIVDGLLDVKGNDIVAFNTEHLTPLFERVIIASGTSNRQTKALASSVRETVKKRGLAVLRTEGEDNGEWIIVDCGAAVAHIMQPNIRDYYRLEEIWGGKPVKMRLDEGAEAGLPKAGTTTAGAGGKARPRQDGRAEGGQDPDEAEPQAACKGQCEGGRQADCQADRQAGPEGRPEDRPQDGARDGSRAGGPAHHQARPGAQERVALSRGGDEVAGGGGRPAPARVGAGRIRRVRAALPPRDAPRAESRQG